MPEPMRRLWFVCAVALVAATEPQPPDQTEKSLPVQPPAVTQSSDRSERVEKTAAPRSASSSPKPLLPVSVERQPYRVKISFAFFADAALPARFRRQLLERIAASIDRIYGGMWTLDVVENRELAPADAIGLSRLPADRSSNDFTPGDYDKVFFLALKVRGARYFVYGREWDSAAQRLGSLQSSDTYQRRAIAHTAAKLVERLFRPVLTIENVSQENAGLRLHAGAFPARDPQAAQLQPGDLIVPFFRYLDRQQRLQKIQFLPWTYLIVEGIERGYVTCAIISGLRSPLGTRRTRRVEMMGLKLRPRDESTQLQLVQRGSTSTQLSGCRVDVVAKTFRREQAQAQPLSLLADRRGTVRVPFNAKQPLVWLYVKSGTAILARVPFVPGVRRVETIELSDDSTRLAVEGEIEMLKSRLVDTVAQRALLLGRARAQARNAKWDEVDRHTAALDQLPGVDQFESEINAVRVQGVEAARRKNDRMGERRIEKLYRDASQLIGRFLDEDKIRMIKEEIEELRKLDEQEK
jgi:hypothetical protein